MIDYDLFSKIKTLTHNEDLSIPQIAGVLDLDKRTVAKWIDEPRYRQRISAPRQSKLDPYKQEIVRMLETYPYSAEQIFQRIKDNGFEGGITIVRDYVRKVRPPKSKAYLKLTFAPGECAQVDWGSYGTVRCGSAERRLSFFVMVLCHCRMMYVEFTVLQTMEHFLACHENAFHYFGGIPEKVMVDNLRSAVLERPLGKAPIFNPKYVDFANHYGFTIVACNVGAPNEKGRVENAVGYVKKNLLAGLEITDFSILAPTARHWLDTVANTRMHGETGTRPIDVYPEERDALSPLPLLDYDVADIRQVRASRQFRVTIDTNYYSVPAQFAGERLTARLYPDKVCFYHDNKLVARHDRCYDRRKDVEDPDHGKTLLVQRKKAREQNVIRRFLLLSDKANDYYRGLKKRRINANHHVEKIVAMSEIYPAESLRQAIDDACAAHAYSSEYIFNLIEARSRIVPEKGVLHLTRPSDLLDLTIDPPDLGCYDIIEKESIHEP